MKIIKIIKCLFFSTCFQNLALIFLLTQFLSLLITESFATANIFFYTYNSIIKQIFSFHFMLISFVITILIFYFLKKNEIIK